MAVREWKSMTPAEQTAWYGQARHGEVSYSVQAGLCDREGHRPLTIWTPLGRLLCGSCGRTLPVPAGEAAPARRTAAA